MNCSAAATRTGLLEQMVYREEFAKCNMLERGIKSVEEIRNVHV